jgi:Protein of unknown function (DUF3443)
VRKLIFLGLIAQALFLLGGCGGGGGGVTTSNNNGGGSGSGTGGQVTNSVTMTVDSGPDPQSGYDADTPFITVTVCAPGSTSNCQTIDHVEVDTGSYGLRIISSVLNSSLATALQAEQGSGGNTLVECTQFVDGFSWGPVKIADMQVGGESAGSVPIQVIGDASYENEIPAACSGTGTEEDTVAAFGANGILGVGPFAADCGSGCVLTNSQYAANPWYYTCPAGGTSVSACQAAGPPESEQVTNPVADFKTDNNGVVIELASATEGATTGTGTLIFGIGTETNNALGAQTVLTADPSYGDISTTYTTQDNHQEFLPFSYFDTGSNAYYFADDGIPSATSCSGQPGYSNSNPQSWFCPSSELMLSATNSGQNGLQSTANLSVGNAYALFNTYSSGTVFNDLAASSGAETTDCQGQGTAAADVSCAFDFGFPFFLGKSVFIALAGATTSGGTGPYYAY